MDRSREYNIPFTKGQKWLEITLENNVLITFALREIYRVPSKYRAILGTTDSRTFFELSFRIPFRKQSNQ